MDIHNCSGCQKKLIDVLRYSYVFEKGELYPYCNICLYSWCNICGGTECDYRCIDCDAACEEICKCYK